MRPSVGDPAALVYANNVHPGWSGSCMANVGEFEVADVAVVDVLSAAVVQAYVVGRTSARYGAALTLWAVQAKTGLADTKSAAGRRMADSRARAGRKDGQAG